MFIKTHILQHLEDFLTFIEEVEENKSNKTKL